MIRESLGCVDINITSKCNCACKYCMSHDGENCLSEEKISQILEKLVELQTRIMVFSGGEPLLYEGYDKLFELADEYGLYTVLLSNGLLVNDKIAESISKSANIVRLTLDSISQSEFDKIKGEGAFEKLLNTFALFRKYNIPINLNMPVQSNDVFDVSKIIKFCISQKVNSIRFSPIIPVENGKEIYKKMLVNILEAIISNEANLYFQDFRKILSINEFINDMKSLSCPGGTISLNINPNGGITKCAFISEELGSLKNNSIEEIWFNNYDKCDNMKCEIISSEEIDIIAEVIEHYYEHYAIRKAVSSWYAEIHGKKKLCLRGLPFWTLNFMHNE